MRKLLLSSVLIVTSLLSSSISLDKMISGMIVVGFDGKSPKDKWVLQIKRDVKRDRIGGIYLSKRNIKNNNRLKELILDIKKDSKSRLFIVTTPLNFSSFNSDLNNLTLKELDKNRDNLYKYIKSIGINALFWPNADLKVENRYSSNSDITLVYLQNELNFLKKYRILPILGHFPGKKVDGKSWDYEELKPFYTLFKKRDVNAVVIDNSINSAIDDKNEALFSDLIVTKLLRKKMGFDGVVFSYDLKSKSISKKYTLKQRVIKAIKAGVDILYFSGYFVNSSNVPKEVKKVIKEAIKEGLIKKSRIESSYMKIQRVKEEALK